MQTDTRSNNDGYVVAELWLASIVMSLICFTKYFKSNMWGYSFKVICRKRVVCYKSLYDILYARAHRDLYEFLRVPNRFKKHMQRLSDTSCVICNGIFQQ